VSDVFITRADGPNGFPSMQALIPNLQDSSPSHQNGSAESQ